MYGFLNEVPHLLATPVEINTYSLPVIFWFNLPQKGAHNSCESVQWVNPLEIHTLRILYAHAVANLNSGYSKYAKVARVHYFCTIALRTSRAVLAWASRRVDLRERRVDLFFEMGNYILLVIFKWLLNLLKCLIYYIIKDKKVCLRCVWIRLTTAYLLCAREFWQNNALVLQFWCLSNALTLRVRALEASKSQRACIILSKFTRKSNTQLLICN